MFRDTDTYDDKHRADSDRLDLFDAAFEAGGELTDYTRQDPNGRLTERDPEPTGFGVDRSDDGAFVSRDRAPVPQIREEDGTVKSDPFAVGNFGPFGGEGP